MMLSQGDNRLRAAFMLCLAMVVAVSCDTIVKFLSSSYPLHEVSLIRYAITLPVGLGFAWSAFRAGRTGINQASTLFLRGFFIAFGNMLFMLAAATISLVDGVAIFFTMPFFVAGIVPFLIGERVPVYRWLMIALGFAGVLVMTRPGTTVFQPESMLALGCAFFYGLGQVFTRKLNRDIPASLISFWQSLVYVAFYAVFAAVFYLIDFGASDNKSLDFLTRTWSFPTLPDLGLMVVAGLLTCLQLPLAVYAYKHAEASFVAPFEYTAMIWAVVWGFIVFGDKPDLPTGIGALIVIAAGIVMLRLDRSKPVRTVI